MAVKFTTILRGKVLQELDIKEDRNHMPRVFSIRFQKLNGEVVFLPRAISSGTGHNMAANRERGFLPVDKDIKSTGHVYPVHIDNLIEYNGLRIKL